MAGYSATPPNHGHLDPASLPRLASFRSESIVRQPFSFAECLHYLPDNQRLMLIFRANAKVHFGPLPPRVKHNSGNSCNMQASPDI